VQFDEQPERSLNGDRAGCLLSGHDAGGEQPALTAGRQVCHNPLGFDGRHLAGEQPMQFLESLMSLFKHISHPFSEVKACRKLDDHEIERI
jgi:hypothetical protein